MLWLPYSPDLSPQIYLVGHLKSNIYSTQTNTLKYWRGQFLMNPSLEKFDGRHFLIFSQIVREYLFFIFHTF